VVSIGDGGTLARGRAAGGRIDWAFLEAALAVTFDAAFAAGACCSAGGNGGGSEAALAVAGTGREAGGGGGACEGAGG
jgi:hypothetical protein